MGGEPVDTVPVLSVHVDKLRVAAVVLDVEPGQMRERVPGAVSSRVRGGRRVGLRDVMVEQVWTRPRGSSGGVYVELRAEAGCLARVLVVEFNPAAAAAADWVAVAGALRRSGVADLRRLVVERYDCAMDYGVPRRVLVLDDRRRAVDAIGCGVWGPQTERSGYRRGSPIRHTLYDKVAEARARGEDVRGPVTRYEVQVRRPLAVGPLPSAGDEGLRLPDLGAVPWPGGDVTVRCLWVHPWRVADPVWASLLVVCRGAGVRHALATAKAVYGWSAERRASWLACGVPVVDPAPDRLWRERWRGAVAEVLRRLRAACDWWGSEAGVPAVGGGAVP